ncbi:MAG: hypothetical protein AAB421_03000 [Patescibacteria group bacterium]
MESVVALDRWILGKVEPLAWRLEYHSGWNSYALGRLCTSLVWLCATVLLGKTALLAMPIAWIGVAFCPFVGFLEDRFLRVVEQSLGKTGTVNPLQEPKPAVIRSTTAIIAMGTVVRLLWLVSSADPDRVFNLVVISLMLAFFVASQYLMACNRMPPRYHPSPRESLTQMPIRVPR